MQLDSMYHDQHTYVIARVSIRKWRLHLVCPIESFQCICHVNTFHRYTRLIYLQIYFNIYEKHTHSTRQFTHPPSALKIHTHTLGLSFVQRVRARCRKKNKSMDKLFIIIFRSFEWLGHRPRINIGPVSPKQNILVVFNCFLQ